MRACTRSTICLPRVLRSLALGVELMNLTCFQKEREGEGVSETGCKNRLNNENIYPSKQLDLFHAYQHFISMLNTI